MKRYIWFLFCMGLVFGTRVFAVETPDAVIHKAGTVEDEKERYRILSELAKRSDLDAGLRADLNRLLPLVDRWANGREKYWTAEEQQRAAENGYLCGFFTHTLRNPDGDDGYRPVATSLLYPIWCFYRGRILIQGPIQSGRLSHDDVLREKYYGEGHRLIQVAQKAFPKNRVMGMYLGQTIPWGRKHVVDANAPTWANDQREGLEKLTDIIHFWIDERQAPDGQFGGGWGDDVEMWRWWTTVLIGFDDAKVNLAQKTISNGLFDLSRMQGGYTQQMSDVEHTGEDSGDTGTAMMHVAPDDSVWQGRALRLAELMQKLWTGRNERGMLQFRSTYFTSDIVHPDSQRACDTVYHPRAVQPTLLYWQRTGNADLTRLFSDWMNTWVDATRRDERGKPAGIVPSAIHWPDGQVGGLGTAWWDPRNHGEATLYEWPSAMNMMMSTLLLTFHMTGDQTYLEPIRSMAAIRATYLAHPVENPEPGSAMWCASKMGFLSDTLGKYRLLTGDTQFDALLKADAAGYVRFRLTGDQASVDQALARNVSAFSYDREAYTTEVRWTDRVFAFHNKYARYYTDQPLPRPDLGMLYSSVTGDFGNPLFFPMNAVRWKTGSRDIAVMVTDHDTHRLKAELYHFGNSERKMGAELYLLQKGMYRWTLVSGEKVVSEGKFDVMDARTHVDFTLPSQRLCTFRVQPVE